MKIIIIVLVILIILYLFIGIYFFHFSNCTKISKKRLFKGKGTAKLNSKESEKWFNDSNYKEVYIKSFDNKKLHAYEIKNRLNTWVIIVHGYTNNALEMLDVAHNFYKKGYSILLIDQRAHGKSDCIYSTHGFYERKDMLSWINYINKKKKTKIILYGISMGGTVIMRTVGEILPSNVICAIEDSGFISNYDQFYNQLKYLKLLPGPIISSFNIFSFLFFGFNIYKFKPEEILMKGKIPFMFIHGSADKLVPPKNAYDAYQLYNGKKKLLIIDGAKHMKSSIVNPQKYYDEIFSFIKENKES